MNRITHHAGSLYRIVAFRKFLNDWLAENVRAAGAVHPENHPASIRNFSYAYGQRSPKDTCRHCALCHQPDGMWNRGGQA
ncbi:MAG: hypothetical protein ACP5I8_06890 [Phycisphaerae bacterium]